MSSGPYPSVPGGYSGGKGGRFQRQGSGGHIGVNRFLENGDYDLINAPEIGEFPIADSSWGEVCDISTDPEY